MLAANECVAEHLEPAGQASRLLGFTSRSLHGQGKAETLQGHGWPPGLAI